MYPPVSNLCLFIPGICAFADISQPNLSIPALLAFRLSIHAIRAFAGIPSSHSCNPCFCWHSVCASTKSALLQTFRPHFQRIRAFATHFPEFHTRRKHHFFLITSIPSVFALMLPATASHAKPSARQIFQSQQQQPSSDLPQSSY